MKADYASYKWAKLDPSLAETRAMVDRYWRSSPSFMQPFFLSLFRDHLFSCRWEGKDEKGRKVYQGKVFK